MNLSQSIGNLSHHAYGIVGDASSRQEIISFLQGECGVVVRGNPDLFVQRYEIFTIDDARSLKSAHATRPFSSVFSPTIKSYNSTTYATSKSKGSNAKGAGKKFFIIEMDSITHEAQNALLKIFEEPNEYAHFFLVIPSEELLLPTLRSRLFMVRPRSDFGQAHSFEQRPRTGAVKVDKNLVDFLSSNKAERIAYVDKMAADISDGKKPKTAALEFCANLSRYIRGDGGIKKNATTLGVIALTESYLRDRSPSIKQLLEYVALRV